MTQPPPPRALSVPAHRLQAFDPVGLGVFEADLRALFIRLSGRSQSAIVSELEQERKSLPDDSAHRDTAAYETTILVLRDYICAGYYPVVSDGRCFLAPIWESESLDDARRRSALQRMYERMRHRELANGQQVRRIVDSTAAIDAAGGYDPAGVLRLLAAGVLEPRLTVVDGAANRRLWNAVRSTWSMMPDRSAPGREISFLLTDNKYPNTPIGILQFRNVVPEIKARDTWLGITVSASKSKNQPTGYAAAVKRSGDASAALRATRQILSLLLESVNPDGLDSAIQHRDVQALTKLARAHRQAFNDSKRDKTSHAPRHLAVSKRAETAAELCRGIRGFNAALDYADVLQALQDPTIAAACDKGLRKIWHYHMGFVAIEVSICGAAPPFGPTRIGKLMAALAASREALNAWGFDRPLGHIASEVYLPVVRERVPNPGPLVLLTSGLYPGHSAQYTRVKVGQASWVKYGQTSGYGSFHVSNAATEAMARFNQAADGYRHITRTFGEGSGARFREVGRALDRLNLPDLRKHNTQRPLYALPLVSDVAGSLFGWADASAMTPACVENITSQWWYRWVEPRLDDLLERSAGTPDLLSALGALIDRSMPQLRQ